MKMKHFAFTSLLSLCKNEKKIRMRCNTRQESNEHECLVQLLDSLCKYQILNELPVVCNIYDHVQEVKRNSLPSYKTKSVLTKILR